MIKKGVFCISMNIFDIVIILLILLAGVVGMKRGIIKEVAIVLGTILVFFLAFLFKDPLAIFFCDVFPMIKVISGIGTLSALSLLFYQLIAFLILVIFFGIIIKALISLTGVLSKLINATIILAIPNKILGFIAGLIEGYLLMFLVITILMIPMSGNDLFMESSVREFILTKSPVLNQTFGGMNNALEEIFAIDDKNTDNEKNLAIIDIALKYDVVTVDFVENAKDSGKLADIEGLDAVINKYRE